MKWIAFFAACWSWGLFRSAADAQDIPRVYSLQRYSVIWQQSLFGFGTNGKPVPNTSEYYSLAGVFRFKDGFGAVIVNRINGRIEQIESGVVSPGGFELLEVLRIPGDGAARVRVRKGGEEFWVGNEQSPRAVSSKLANNAP